MNSLIILIKYDSILLVLSIVFLLKYNFNYTSQMRYENIDKIINLVFII